MDNVDTEFKQNSYKTESLNMIIPDKLFVGGIIEGVNFKSRGNGLIDLNDYRDLIISFSSLNSHSIYSEITAIQTRHYQVHFEKCELAN